MNSARSTPRLLAVSDLHAAARENGPIVDGLRPEHEDDWLIVAGDVAEVAGDFTRVMSSLAERFNTVIWAPGNHELWTHPADPLPIRGQQRYLHLVATCRELGISTPEDAYPVWDGDGGPVVVAPLFVLYDYSFRVAGARTVAGSVALARESGVVCSDEFLLHPDPFPTREAWCAARVAYTEARLADIDPSLRTVLVNHYPLVREPTDVLWYPEFAQWCGTVRTREWHTRFRAEAVVYGHLHIPRTTYYDGVRFEEVSLGYPREWTRRPGVFAPRQIMPAPT